MNVVLPNDFTPRSYQLDFMRYLDGGGKNAFWVMHRRAGKDLTAMHQTCRMMHKRRGAYWHIFPSFAQARKAIWEGYRKDGKRIMENVFPGFLDPKRAGSIVKRKDEQQMMIELKCGSVWRLIGSDRIEVVGAGPVGVVFSEYALANPMARNLIRPMLRENDGWQAYITTPRGNNHARELYEIAKKEPGWFCQVLTLEDTGAWREMRNDLGLQYQSAHEVMDDERRAGMPDALVRQEYQCDWTAALAGAVYGDLLSAVEKAGNLAAFDHDMNNVFTSWDLGYTDSTAIWFWKVSGDGVDVVDYYENHGKPLSHYYDEIERRPFAYIKHWLPHDARQVTLSSGVSILNQMLKRWPGQVTVGPDLPLLDGIQAGRWLLQQPVKFHPRAAGGVAALREYHYEYDEESKTYSPRPAHTWASHGADAFRYLASVVKTSKMLHRNRTEPELEEKEPVVRTAHYGFNLEELHDWRGASNAGRRRI